MQPWRLLRGAIAGLVALVSLPLLAGAARGQGAICADVAERGYLGVLTINLLFSEVERRDERLAALVEYITPDDGDGGPPLADVILVQEFVGGLLAGTNNSARDLQRLLLRKGFAFELRTATEIGVPGLLTVGNATLSRCDIRFSLVGLLPPAREFEVGGTAVPVPRNVLMTRIHVPGFGGVNVYNTHLCAFCTVGRRGAQVEALLDFIDRVEGFLPGEHPVALGGDFNIDVFEGGGAQRGLYDRIAGPEGDFADAYAAAAADDPDDLCDPGGEPFPDEHCTYGVTPLSDPDVGRIDYVFAKNFGPVLDATVLFNPVIDPGEPTVSDHAGVLVSVRLRDAALAAVR